MFERHGISRVDAAWIVGIYQLGGCLGSLVISIFLDKLSFLLVAALFALSVPVTALMGLPDASLSFLAWMTGLAGFFGQSVQLAINTGAGLLHPTAERSQAVDWAFAIGRLGAVAGPMLGGAAFRLNLPFPTLLLIPALPMALGGVAPAALTVILLRRSGSLRMSAAA